MRFDFVIGNPPYQDEAVGTQKNYGAPIYGKFMEASYQVADAVELIHPARFLYGAGGTDDEWVKKILNDPHFKVLDEQASSAVFSGVDIKGGVAITYRDASKNFGAIGVYIPYAELRGIFEKVRIYPQFMPLSDIIANRGLYRFSKKAYDERPDEMAKTSDSRVGSSAFDRMPSLFFDEAPDDGFEYVRFFGLVGKKTRVYKWMCRDYFNMVDSFDKYKIFVPKANGSGSLGEVLSTPVIGQPVIGHTETFLSVGSFDTEDEAKACYKYLCSKFARTMLGILKVTQDNTAEKWRFVPLQDFTGNSDIDWGKSIPEIDAQLYAKYGLDENEIRFIEEKVRAME